mmetsp:Transcript_14919/g.36602  ORF Transcript_14919/g.36602 Transcript_14919/m.36602 type:complete len:306 (+) Transcript_14919:2877-3794(+)
MLMSGSFKQSTTVFLCFCNAAEAVLALSVGTLGPSSVCCCSTTHLDNVFNATYRMLLSRLSRNRPNIFTARTRNPSSLSMPMIVWTHSYRMALPAFFDESVLVATCANTSFISSDAFSFLAPSKRNSVRSWTCRNGSEIPATSYSGEYPELNKLRSILTSIGTSRRKAFRQSVSNGSSPSSSAFFRSIIKTWVINWTTVITTPWFLSFSNVTTRSTKSSTMSGHFVRHLAMARLAFFRRYGMPDLRCLSTSGAKSRDMSAVAKFPIVHSARPATNLFWEFISFLIELVANIRTSASSDKSSIIPR